MIEKPNKASAARPTTARPPAGPSVGLATPRMWRWLAITIVVLSLAAAFRYLVVEPRSMGFACSETPTPWWCAPREWVIMLHLNNVWGAVALASGILALFFRQNWALPVALVTGLAGMMLYDTSLSAIGFLFALMRMLRN